MMRKPIQGGMDSNYGVFVKSQQNQPPVPNFVVEKGVLITVRTVDSLSGAGTIPGIR